MLAKSPELLLFWVCNMQETRVNIDLLEALNKILI